MPYKLYILKNTKGRHYIGISSNIEQRLKTHNAGYVRSTKTYRPWSLVYTELHASRIEARKREVLLKNNFEARNKIFLLL